MISIKGKSQKTCIFCESKDTAEVKVKGERDFQGAVCRDHLWNLLKEPQNGALQQEAKNL